MRTEPGRHPTLADVVAVVARVDLGSLLDRIDVAAHRHGRRMAEDGIGTGVDAAPGRS
jgi:hypothetical protein